MPTKLKNFLLANKRIKPGSGVLSEAVALALAALCLLGVLAFHFPAYLTTPDLRKIYDVQIIRYLILGALIYSGATSIVNLIFGRLRGISCLTLSLLFLSFLLGGSSVEVDPNFPAHTPYVGLDWFTLDLLGSACVFIFMEKIMPLRRTQRVFRQEWSTDLIYFGVNHLLIGFLLLATNQMVQSLVGWADRDDLQAWVQNLPFFVALPLIILVADLMQYWVHRMCHQVPFLWRFHAIHHSIKQVDWLAGSRLHIVDLLLFRILVLAPITFLGFSRSVVDAYIVIVGFQAVFNHANVNVRLGAMRYVLVTPNFHHWHHSQDGDALDRNFAAHFAFLDYVFGTAVRSQKTWPKNYGVRGDYVPAGYLKQLLFPFSCKVLRHGIKRQKKPV